jgi:hypothetical protein
MINHSWGFGRPSDVASMYRAIVVRKKCETSKLDRLGVFKS